MFMAVTMVPSFANSMKPRDFEYLSSATSMIMMFEAAPRSVRFPAMVELQASTSALANKRLVEKKRVLYV